MTPGDRVVKSLVFSAVFCRSLFVLRFSILYCTFYIVDLVSCSFGILLILVSCSFWYLAHLVSCSFWYLAHLVSCSFWYLAHLVSCSFGILLIWYLAHFGILLIWYLAHLVSSNISITFCTYLYISSMLYSLVK